MKDLHNNIKVEQTLKPQVLTGNGTSTTAAVVDRQGYESVEHIVNMGLSADTLSGALKMDLILMHGDLANGSDLAAVTEPTYALGTIDSSGIFATVDDAAEDETVFKVGYVGPKRYSAVKITRTGNHATGTPIGVLALKGHPASLPVS